jgi:hypothetical protein
MNIRAIICFAVVLGLHSRAIGSTSVTMVALNTNFATLEVTSNQVAKIVYTTTYATVFISSLEASIVYSSGLTVPQPVPIIAGPATFRLNGGGNGATNFCTVEISSSTEQLVPSNAAVIPSDSTGPVNIILESSADLINWYPSLPGAYGANYTNRFFRVRAQRAP